MRFFLILGFLWQFKEVITTRVVLKNLIFSNVQISAETGRNFSLESFTRQPHPIG